MEAIALTVIPNEAGRSWVGAGEGSPRSDFWSVRWGERLVTYYVYIMTNGRHRLCLGITNDHCRRVYKHNHRLVPDFTRKYFMERLVYFEDTDDVGAAIAREKEPKSWRRSKKIALIRKANPQWSDPGRALVEHQGRGELGQIASRRSLTHSRPTPPHYVRDDSQRYFFQTKCATNY